MKPIPDRFVTDVQRHVRHPAQRWMAATLDGRVEASGAVFKRVDKCGGGSSRRSGHAMRPSATLLIHDEDLLAPIETPIADR